MTDIHEKLSILYELLVDNTEKFQDEIINLISQPDSIQNTNKFASLLSNLKNTVYISPLLIQISLADKLESWLTDYLYSVINLLDETSVDDEFDMPEKLIEKLEDWILNHTGELAWKAANLLKFYESEAAEKIQLKKLKENNDFFLVYAECILGLLRFDNDKHIELVKSISRDNRRDEKLRDFCDEAIKNYS